MKRPIVLLGVILLCLEFGRARAHPIESKISVQWINALRDKLRESELFTEFEFPDAVVEDKDVSDYGSDGLSIERIPCINLGNDGCVNGSIVGSGGDGGYLEGGGNPGK